MLSEQDYNDLIAATQLLMGIIGRHGQDKAEREEIKKNSVPTEMYFSSPALRW